MPFRRTPNSNAKDAASGPRVQVAVATARVAQRQSTVSDDRRWRTVFVTTAQVTGTPESWWKEDDTAILAFTAVGFCLRRLGANWPRRRGKCQRWSGLSSPFRTQASSFGVAGGSWISDSWCWQRL